MKKLVIVGTGETAMLAYEYFTYDSEYEVVAFAVDKEFLQESVLFELPVVAIEELTGRYPTMAYEVFVALGSGKLNRQRTAMYHKVKELGYGCASYISSKAFVWKNAQIGENCFILEDNTIQPFTTIGNNVYMWSGNHLGHRSVIEDNCFITSHVVISGFCSIGKNSFIGVNVAIADNISIGEDNFIGMNSCLSKSTKDNSLYVCKGTELTKLPAKTFMQVGE